nr:hypothetical protein [Tanacetum cinerariifolium]
KHRWHNASSCKQLQHQIIQALFIFSRETAELVQQEALKEKTDSGSKQEEEKCSILIVLHI